jgi:protein involved in polysaccharide export with SLBB domain
MRMLKVGQIWGRLCIASSLLLVGLLFAGCQTTGGDAGFSEVPGIESTAQGGTSPGSTAATPAVVPNTVPTATTNLSAEIVKVGEVLIITFGDLPENARVPAFDQKVKDDGTITLIYNQPFQAAGKRTGDLEQEIRAFYVPKYFKNLTVTVRQPAERFFYVDGEVKVGNKVPYTGPITVSKAIAAAGGFTDFANKRSIKLIRADGRSQKVNYNKALAHPEQPELDPPVFPDDKIHVPRRLF